MNTCVCLHVCTGCTHFTFMSKLLCGSFDISPHCMYFSHTHTLLDIPCPCAFPVLDWGCHGNTSLTVFSSHQTHTKYQKPHSGGMRRGVRRRKEGQPLLLLAVEDWMRFWCWVARRQMIRCSDSTRSKTSLIPVHASNDMQGLSISSKTAWFSFKVKISNVKRIMVKF